ncbi:TPA: hypothetical protein U2L63_002236 [Citrobacter braakii]|uniref:hypothetical protein n=1 Tax=unclassified Citrobacter TaxID=2644389 RepID=UPI0015E9C513|nr:MULTISPECIES: hypothetical protein [unclassified Citrobacter]HCB1681171.1 hypothetical protein [Citrobacter braakii]MDM3314887.1 hypothetical protein [Citrobacter sp. Cb220]QLR49366.1 hypothetical protein HV345_20270 [Citrobacter sp. RHBSTW-00986]HEM7930755.1 hypothetical protein [Citrobacter braakii]HEM7957462.1 hypothetical protein [Citrobacter braakii]
MFGNIVLETALLVEYLNHTGTKKYKKLLKKLSFPYSTNKKQWMEAKVLGLNDLTYNRILPMLMNEGEKDDSLEELASKSALKVILTEDPLKKLPYVHYKDGMISNNVTIKINANESRDDLKTYLELLCRDACKIVICDNYFAKNWDNTKSLFYSILPRSRLFIEYAETPVNLNVVLNSTKITNQFAQSIYSEWSVQQTIYPKYTNCHDRYLLIEMPSHKIEILLSSGFDHIWKTNPKELTCVFRNVI